jgi:hypothetical protein
MNDTSLQLQFRLSKETTDKLVKLANDAEVSVEDLIRVLLALQLQKEKG